MKRTALFLMAILFLCSCAGNRAARIQEKMKTWEGKHFNDLVAALGPPARVMDDGQGGKIFIYSASRKTYSPGFSWTSSRGQVNRQGDIYMSSKGWIPGNTGVLIHPDGTRIILDKPGRLYLSDCLC
jgi:hypothetical protein